MSAQTIERCIELLRKSRHVTLLDITGGAPELSTGFRRLVEAAAQIRDEDNRPDLRIIDRCNLTVLLEPGQEDLSGFLAKNGVDIVASLPSYDASQTDRQRGKQVFERSIEGLQILNAHGYGSSGPTLKLDLVFNPPGAFLPPRQEPLEAKYKEMLMKDHGIEFNNLATIANMPVKRFFDHLSRQKTLDGYMDLLVRNFNSETVPHLMCVNHVNVKWDGTIYDCDFNQQLELRLGSSSESLTLFNIADLDDAVLKKAPIRTAAHCYGCTAAQGSG